MVYMLPTDAQIAVPRRGAVGTPVACRRHYAIFRAVYCAKEIAENILIDE